ncbi:MAG: hypothetical protein EOL89_01390 [Actinobacteria bacterium]|nr:hypothetical protein [Actinomycetota bacterium]
MSGVDVSPHVEHPRGDLEPERQRSHARTACAHASPARAVHSHHPHPREARGGGRVQPLAFQVRPGGGGDRCRHPRRGVRPVVGADQGLEPRQGPRPLRRARLTAGGDGDGLLRNPGLAAGGHAGPGAGGQRAAASG